jgi:uncharacterized paraquat-inducible protein A
MSQTTELLILLVLLAVVVVSVLLIRRRQRVDRHALDAESPYAVSTEGQKRCPSCGMFNGWTSRTCVSCGRPLQG